MRATWYVLEDDSAVDPADVAPDDKGVLRHKDGLAVAMRHEDVPRTRGVDLDDKPADDAARKAAEEAEAKRKADEEAAAVKAAEEAAAKKKTEEDEAARKVAEDEAAKKAAGADRQMKPGKGQKYKTR